MVATPTPTAFSQQTRASKGNDDCADDETVENGSVHTLAGFLIDSTGSTYSHEARRRQSYSPSRGGRGKKRERVHDRERESSAAIEALNQFIFQAGNIYHRGKTLSQSEKVRLKDAANQVGLSMAVVDTLIEQTADSNAIVNYCIASDDTFARKIKEDASLGSIFRDGSLSGEESSFDIADSVWRVFMLKIVQQFLKEHNMALGDVMKPSSLTSQLYQEAVGKNTIASEYDKHFPSDAFRIRRNYTEERKRLSIPESEARKARLEADAMLTFSPARRYQETNLDSPFTASRGQLIYQDSRDDEIMGTPRSKFQFDSRCSPASSPLPRKATDSAQKRSSLGTPINSSPQEKAHASTKDRVSSERAITPNKSSDKQKLSSVKRGLAVFGKTDSRRAEDDPPINTSARKPRTSLSTVGSSETNKTMVKKTNDQLSNGADDYQGKDQNGDLYSHFKDMPRAKPSRKQPSALALYESACKKAASSTPRKANVSTEDFAPKPSTKKQEIIQMFENSDSKSSGSSGPQAKTPRQQQPTPAPIEREKRPQAETPRQQQPTPAPIEREKLEKYENSFQIGDDSTQAKNVQDDSTCPMTSSTRLQGRAVFENGPSKNIVTSGPSIRGTTKTSWSSRLEAIAAFENQLEHDSAAMTVTKHEEKKAMGSTEERNEADYVSDQPRNTDEVDEMRSLSDELSQKLFKTSRTSHGEAPAEEPEMFAANTFEKGIHTTVENQATKTDSNLFHERPDVNDESGNFRMESRKPAGQKVQVEAADGHEVAESSRNELHGTSKNHTDLTSGENAQGFKAFQNSDDRQRHFSMDPSIRKRRQLSLLDMRPDFISVTVSPSEDQAILSSFTQSSESSDEHNSYNRRRKSGSSTRRRTRLEHSKSQRTAMSPKQPKEAAVDGRRPPNATHGGSKQYQDQDPAISNREDDALFVSFFTRLTSDHIENDAVTQGSDGLDPNRDKRSLNHDNRSLDEHQTVVNRASEEVPGAVPTDTTNSTSSSEEWVTFTTQPADREKPWDEESRPNPSFYSGIVQQHSLGDSIFPSDETNTQTIDTRFPSDEGSTSIQNASRRSLRHSSENRYEKTFEPEDSDLAYSNETMSDGNWRQPTAGKASPQGTSETAISRRQVIASYHVETSNPLTWSNDDGTDPNPLPDGLDPSFEPINSSLGRGKESNVSANSEILLLHETNNCEMDFGAVHQRNQERAHSPALSPTMHTPPPPPPPIPPQKQSGARADFESETPNERIFSSDNSNVGYFSKAPTFKLDQKPSNESYQGYKDQKDYDYNCSDTNEWTTFGDGFTNEPARGNKLKDSANHVSDSNSLRLLGKEYSAVKASSRPSSPATNEVSGSALKKSQRYLARSETDCTESWAHHKAFHESAQFEPDKDISCDGRREMPSKGPVFEGKRMCEKKQTVGPCRDGINEKGRRLNRQSQNRQSLPLETETDTKMPQFLSTEDQHDNASIDSTKFYDPTLVQSSHSDVQESESGLADFVASRKNFFDSSKIIAQNPTTHTAISSSTEESGDRYDIVQDENLAKDQPTDLRLMSYVQDRNWSRHFLPEKRKIEMRDYRLCYQSKESVQLGLPETPSTNPVTDQASSIGEWTPGHWVQEDHRILKRPKTYDESQVKDNSSVQSDIEGLNSLSSSRDSFDALNPLQAHANSLSRSQSSESDFNALNSFEDEEGLYHERHILSRSASERFATLKQPSALVQSNPLSSFHVPDKSSSAFLRQPDGPRSGVASHDEDTQLMYRVQHPQPVFAQKMSYHTEINNLRSEQIAETASDQEAASVHPLGGSKGAVFRSEQPERSSFSSMKSRSASEWIQFNGFEENAMESVTNGDKNGENHASGAPPVKGYQNHQDAESLLRWKERAMMSQPDHSETLENLPIQSGDAKSLQSYSEQPDNYDSNFIQSTNQQSFGLSTQNYPNSASHASNKQEEELRKTAYLRGIPAHVVDAVLGQARMTSKALKGVENNTDQTVSGIRSTCKSPCNRERFDATKNLVGDYSTCNRHRASSCESEGITSDKSSITDMPKSWDTGLAMDNCDYVEHHVTYLANHRPTTLPCPDGSHFPIRRDPSPVGGQSVSSCGSTSSDKPQGATRAELKLLNRFIEVAAANFDGKKLSADSEVRVRAAALKVGLSQKFVDQLLEQAKPKVEPKVEVAESARSSARSRTAPNTPDATRTSSRFYTVDLRHQNYNEASKASNTSKEAEVTNCGCDFWEGISKNFSYWTKSTPGDDASSISSTPSLSWEQENRGPPSTDQRRAYV